MLKKLKPAAKDVRNRVVGETYSKYGYNGYTVTKYV